MTLLHGLRYIHTFCLFAYPGCLEPKETASASLAAECLTNVASLQFFRDRGLKWRRGEAGPTISAGETVEDLWEYWVEGPN